MDISFTTESLANFVSVADEAFVSGEVMFDIRLKDGVLNDDAWLCCNLDRDGVVALRDHLNKLLGEQ